MLACRLTAAMLRCQRWLLNAGLRAAALPRVDQKEKKMWTLACWLVLLLQHNRAATAIRIEAELSTCR
jgi:hypothetical protein